MKTKLLKTLFLSAFVIFGVTNVSAQVFDFSTDLQGWAQHWGPADPVSHNPTEGVTGDGALELARTSNNSGFGLNSSPGIDANTMQFVRMRYKNESNATSFRFQGDSSDGAIAQTSFSIGAGSTEYVTSYFDLSTVTNWSGNVTNLDILVRAGYSDGEGHFFLDEIEFLSSMPPVQYSEFIQNPSFDGPSGTGHLTGSRSFATRGITTTDAHDGSQSLRFTYTADAAETLTPGEAGYEAGTFWNFSNFEKDYSPTLYTAGSELEIKMWVRTNRTTPISIAARVKLGNGTDYSQSRPITNVLTTNVGMGWEELTFTLVSEAAFDRVTFWYALTYFDPASDPAPSPEELSYNLLSGDEVYIDQMSATITDGTLGIIDNLLDEVSVYPNPASDILNINGPEGSNIEVYNILGILVDSQESISANQTLNVSNLSSGLYILKLEMEGRTTTKKFQVK